MSRDQELIEIARRHHRFYARWGRPAGALLLVAGLALTALSCLAVARLLNGADEPGHRVATTLPAGVGIQSLVRNTTFLMGIAVGTLLTFSGVLGLAGARMGLLIIARGDWRDTLIFKLTEPTRDAE